MKFINDEGKARWEKTANANRDEYGSGVIRFVEKWTELMETELAQGQKLEDIAERTSNQADEEGITGYMYGAAVSIIGQVWEHGDALRRWHNLKIQIGNEGEKANESGGTLNPAMMSFG